MVEVAVNMKLFMKDNVVLWWLRYIHEIITCQRFTAAGTLKYWGFQYHFQHRILLHLSFNCILSRVSENFYS